MVELHEQDGEFGSWQSELNGLTGQTHADNVKHAITRAAFVRYLMSDVRVWDAFSRWLDIIGLAPPARRVHELWATFGQLVDLDDPERWRALMEDEEVELHLFDGADEEQACTVFGELQDAVEALHEAAGRVSQQFPGQIAEEAKAFVLQFCEPLNRPWLALELIEAFWLNIYYGSLLMRPHKEVWVEPIDSEASLEGWTAPQPRAGEAVREYLQRLADEHARFQERAARTLVPEGTMTQATVRACEKNAEWLYRHEIAGEPIRSITRSVYGAHMADANATAVRRGIKEAKRVLGLTPHTY